MTPTKASFPYLARRRMGAVLPLLANSSHMFHLAGSFFFGVAKAESDIDLYAQHSPALVEFLALNGFYMLGVNDQTKYPDLVAIPERDVATQNNTYAVYEHHALPIHVQVFYDLEVALATRNILAKSFKDEHSRTRGPSRSAMWVAAEKAAREILSLASPA